ncbi:MAG: 16S rRNA (cytosine(967)-C(5))-methyltransferase RsmB [Desulfomonile tiedjei]|uniref:16S rRNA (cytosine(967)-C(5))-methyltransferase n=1 Tax=Desulfomonile tiedjei TaxID=2358 RepID=A0A9D6Z1M6_9BACT|nr:16S rRNA (cytosine(967)-C(5))-methyltransferase RsmB [Desulfomonile tiedjei]
MPSSIVTKSREIALGVLDRVRSGEFAEAALSTILERESPSQKDRALATELVYGVLRWQDRLDSIVRQCLARPGKKPDPHVSAILRMALYQLFFLDRVPDHAAVDQAVAQAKHSAKHSASFVNAVLRKALRERGSLDHPPSNSPDALAVYYSHPEWLVRKWMRQYGLDRTAEILRHNNSRPLLELRVNGLKSDLTQVVKILSAQGVETNPVSHMADALQIAGAAGSVDALPGFREGFFLIQGLASQMIAPLLNPEPGQRILDACAAPGGKTAHLAALTADKAEVTALDANPARLHGTAQNLQRLGVRSARLVQGDAADPELLEGLGTFDRILLDAPCSNLGVLRHNPEAKYRLTRATLVKMAGYQARLLENTASALKRGGILLYTVCSFSEEETHGVLTNFLKRNPGYATVPFSPEELISGDFLDARGFFATFPPNPDFPLDGFFAARLSRN